MRVFEFTDYKAFMFAKLKENQAHRGYRSELAKAMQCQRSFLSQVLNSTADISSDQAAGLFEFWGLTDDEANYFLDLVLLARTTNGPLRRVLKLRIDQSKKKAATLSENFKWPSIGESDGSAIYYSSWFWSAIHILVETPQAVTATAIANRLHLPVHTVESALTWLSANKLIARTKTGWKNEAPTLYLNAKAPMINVHHSNWRQRALFDIQKQNAQSLHYTSVFAVSLDDFQKMKELLVSGINAHHGLIRASPSEETVCLSCDLFVI